MLRIALVVALSAAALPGAATAQTQPSAVRANNAAAASIGERQYAQAGRNLDAQAQYQADLAAYDSAVMRHDARADRQAAHYRHQQRAYADAMRDWRRQDRACRRGHHRACTAPSPDPANYW